MSYVSDEQLQVEFSVLWHVDLLRHRVARLPAAGQWGGARVGEKYSCRQRSTTTAAFDFSQYTRW